MKKLLIVGAGGWGRVVRQWALDMQHQAPRWEAILFLDDNPAVLDGFGLNDSLIGNIRDHKPSGDEEFICGIGDPAIKLNVCEQLSQRGAHLSICFIRRPWSPTMAVSASGSLSAPSPRLWSRPKSAIL